MKLAIFFEKFDQLVETPGAVEKVRSLLIHFAVGGELVPNDEREVPVRLKLSDSSESSMPANWRMGILGDAFNFEYGDNLPAPKRTQSGEYPVYGSNGIVGTHDTYLTKDPAIIVGRKGSAGALNIATGPSWTTDVAYYVRPPRDIDLRFSYYLFSTLGLDELGKGIKPGLSRKEAYGLPIAIPPLAEQKRIVAKVDELMRLCDRLQAQQKEREPGHAALARASLARFADSPNSANLSFLFHGSYDIPPAELRKSILTLAVQGKLVPQDPNERPENLPTASRLEPNGLSIPSTWSLLPLIGVAEQIVDCPHSTPQWASTGKICVRTNQFKPGMLDLSTSKFVSEETFKNRIERLRPEHDDILYSREGGILGVACRVPGNVEICLGQRMMLIRTNRSITPAYLEMVLNAPLITAIARRETTGGAAPRINVSTVKAYPIPVPPLAEQHRIVAKVEQLMVLVDELETQLAASRTTAANLLSAVVAELTSQGRHVPTGQNRARAKMHSANIPALP